MLNTHPLESLVRHSVRDDDHKELRRSLVSVDAHLADHLQGSQEVVGSPVDERVALLYSEGARQRREESEVSGGAEYFD